LRKALTLLMLVVLAASLMGCPTVSQEVKDEIHLNYERTKRYCELMADGKTTADQDKRMIESQKKAWAAMDYKIGENETAKPDAE